MKESINENSSLCPLYKGLGKRVCFAQDERPLLVRKVSLNFRLVYEVAYDALNFVEVDALT